jgi:pre-rRNA-processing protein IPI3
MDVKPLERMRVGKTAKDVQEVSLVIKPHSSASKLAALRPPRLAEALQSGQTQNATKDDEQLATVLAENKKLRAQLERATKINEKMWSNIVDQHLPSAPAPTQS